jgi:hypothetical protein
MWWALQNTPHSKDWGVKQTKYLTDYTQETWMKPLKITRFARKLDPTFHSKVFDLNKKSLKISKGQSETVYRRRTSKCFFLDLPNVWEKLIFNWHEKRRRGAWTVSQNICDEKTIVILV